MADSRRGLNCTLRYTRNGTLRVMRVRADSVAYGVQMVADESSGRNRRAYYPHRIAPGKFFLRVLLSGFTERKTFADWLQTYADYVMNPGLPGGNRFPDMTVIVPARDFYRSGVPLTGFDWGDTIGGMLWTPTVTFETTRDPLDTTSWTPSAFHAATDPDPTLKYFWPSGTQLGGQAVPSGSYTTVIDGSDGGSDRGQTPAQLPRTSTDSDPGFERDAFGN